MKRFIGLILLALALISCNDDITNVYQQESSSSVEVMVSSSSATILRSSSSSEIEAPLSSEFIESSSSELLIESSSSITVASSSSIAVFSSSSDTPSSSSVAVSSSSIVVESSSSSFNYILLTDDSDGKVYKSILIGNQLWMAENINRATSNSFCYGGISDNCSKYGRFYSWDDADTICPSGWHLPSDDDWKELRDYVEKNNGEDSAGFSLKSKTGWNDDGNGSDAFGFSALAAGYCEEKYSSCRRIGDDAVFWTSSTAVVSDGTRLADYAWLIDDTESFWFSADKDYHAKNVRCLNTSLVTP